MLSILFCPRARATPSPYISLRLCCTCCQHFNKMGRCAKKPNSRTIATITCMATPISSYAKTEEICLHICIVLFSGSTVPLSLSLFQNIYEYFLKMLEGTTATLLRTTRRRTRNWGMAPVSPKVHRNFCDHLLFYEAVPARTRGILKDFTTIP